MRPLAGSIVKRPAASRTSVKLNKSPVSGSDAATVATSVPAGAFSSSVAAFGSTRAGASLVSTTLTRTAWLAASAPSLACSVNS